MEKFTNALGVADRYVLKFETALLVICVPVMFVMGLLQVITRFVIHAPISWSEGLLTFLFLWTSYIGASLAVAHRNHFQVDLFTSFLPAGAQRVCEKFADICIIAFCIYLIVEGNFLMWRNQRQIIGLLQISVFWGFLCLPVSATCMLIHSLKHLFSAKEA